MLLKLLLLVYILSTHKHAFLEFLFDGLLAGLLKFAAFLFNSGFFGGYLGSGLAE